MSDPLLDLVKKIASDPKLREALESGDKLKIEALLAEEGFSRPTPTMLAEWARTRLKEVSPEELDELASPDKLCTQSTTFLIAAPAILHD